jgi:hypothetical protein
MKADPESKHGIDQTEPGKKEYEKPQLFVYETLQALTGGRPSN